MVNWWAEPCMWCWRKALDLNAMIEIPFEGGSGRGPNMISVPEHSTWRVWQWVSKRDHPVIIHTILGQRVWGWGGRWKVTSRLLHVQHLHSFHPTIFLFLLTSRGGLRESIGLTLLCQFGGSKGNGSLVETNRSNSFYLRRLHTHQRLLHEKFLWNHMHAVLGILVKGSYAHLAWLRNWHPVRDCNTSRDTWFKLVRHSKLWNLLTIDL